MKIPYYINKLQQLKDAKIIKLLSENDGENNENEIYKLIVIKNCRKICLVF